MANGIYKAVLHMRYLGQSLVNTLWYRSVLEGTFASDLLIDGAKALGNSIIDNIWVHSWRGCVPSNCYLDDVSIVGYNDMFELLYNNTIQVVPQPAQTAGTGVTGESYLPIGNCANIAFSLKNRIIANPLFKPPTKGLIAVSPVTEVWAGNDGTLNDAGMAAFKTIADDVAKGLPWEFIDIDLPFVGWSTGLGLENAFLPLRAKTWQFDLPQVIGGITVMKHIETTDVESAAPRKLLGYRRSRRVEG